MNQLPQRSVSQGSQFARTPFSERVRAVVREIPKGQTMTYKQVATAAGSAGGARAVGMIMRNNYDPTVPCHRVIRSDGTLGGYNRGGIVMKEKCFGQKDTHQITESQFLVVFKAYEISLPTVNARKIS